MRYGGLIFCLMMIACGLDDEQQLKAGSLNIPLVADDGEWELNGTVVARSATLNNNGACPNTATPDNAARVAASLHSSMTELNFALPGGCWVLDLVNTVLTHQDGTEYACAAQSDNPCSYDPNRAGVLIDDIATVRYGQGAKTKLEYTFYVPGQEVAFTEGALDISFTVEEEDAN